MAWILLVVVFAGLWTYAFYREDRSNPEPVWMVLLASAGGAAAFFLANVVEGWLVPDLAALDGPLHARARVAFLVAGPVEEGAKLLAVLLLVWPRTHFDETVDGLVYGAAAGAGFALVENLAFMQGQPEVALSRAPVGTGAHVLFGAIWGGALGHAGHEAARWRRAGITACGLALAAAAHGAFNLIVFSVGRELDLQAGRAAQIALVLACAAFLRWRLAAALRQHPFRYRRKSGAGDAGD